MKLLIDSCVWAGDRHALIERGHDVIYAADWVIDPGDRTILQRAVEENRVVVTLDKDFGTLIAVEQAVHCGIIRLVEVSGPRQLELLRQVIERCERELRDGAIVTAQPGRIRVRSRPPSSDA